MKHLSTLLLFVSAICAFQVSHLATAQSINDIQEYCQSMTSLGMSKEDLQSFINDCIEEQSSYLEQEQPSEQYEDSTYDEPVYIQENYDQEQHCYAKVDEHIQKLLDVDPNTEFDYDQLIDQCLSGK